MKAYKRYLTEIQKPAEHYKEQFYKLEEIRKWLIKDA